MALQGVKISKNDRFLRANEQIKFSPLVVIDESGERLGEMSRSDALTLAYDKGLDLVEIDPTGRPPVCKIMDFGKYKYEQSKKQKESRARQKEVELKEVRLTFKIGDHDIEYKAKNARDFFDQGDRVKVSMRLRGRENAFVDNALEVFAKFAEKAGLDYESRPMKAGNQITAMMTEKKESKENKIDISKEVKSHEIKDPQSNSQEG